MSKGDELIYNTLFKLQEYCENRSKCAGCDFCTIEGDDYRCILIKLFKELSRSPYMYNMEAIRRLLEYDIQEGR